jgi:ribonuclease R
VEPLFQEGTPLLLARDGVKPQAGDLVLFSQGQGRRARIGRVLGRKTVLGDVLDALLLDNLVERGFGPEVEGEAAEAAALEHRRDTFRADLRDLFTFTVDPATARDFDDALSFVPGPAGLTTVYVHIADVSYYVGEGTALDEEALRRATSVYVATGVEPMLPGLLSAGVCSLQPGHDRKAVTVEADVDPEGRVKRVVFYRSLIRSDQRLDYDELEDVFRGGQVPSPALTQALALGRPLAQRLRRNRFERGSLRITSTEPEFHYDQGGTIIGAHRAEELESHGFIEEYMLLANEQVATYLERERVPAVYRVHDLPDPFAVDHLLDVLAGLDLPTPVFDPLQATPADLRRVVRETADWVDRATPRGRGKAALVAQVLRAQARAVYQTENIGHFGLALGTYTHFTSPIRRYPDLLVHRALLARLGLGPQPTTSTLAEWAEHCSLMERQAAKVELKGDDIALAHLLKARLDREGWGTVFEAQILSLVHAGAFVLFEDLYQAFLPARALPGDYYELDEAGTALVGRRTGQAYRLADILRVQVTGVDEARGRVDAAPVLPGERSPNPNGDGGRR